ncbi:MAG: hypothetical protein ISS74_09900 [Planctomycetes bacterium]|nr:hypothetical protein [Planctomycetota bacterium]
MIAAAPLAAATEQMRLAIPPWGCVLLLGVGTAYLVLGSRWSRLFTVLSMTFLGCIIGLVVSQWVPLAQPLVIAAGGVVVGGLAALFRDVALAVLVSLVLAAVLMVLAGLIVGDQGFTSYLAVNLSDTSYSTQWSAPNLAHDAVLAAFLTGLLAGAAIGLGYPAVSRRLAAAGQGAAILLVGVTELVGAWRSEAEPSLASQYPLTLTACWVCLVVIGMRVAQAVERLDEPLGTDEGDGRDQGV